MYDSFNLQKKIGTSTVPTDQFKSIYIYLYLFIISLQYFSLPENTPKEEK